MKYFAQLLGQLRINYIQKLKVLKALTDANISVRAIKASPLTQLSQIIFAEKPLSHLTPTNRAEHIIKPFYISEKIYFARER